MAKGDPIIVGLKASDAPVPQPNARFTNRPWGLDDGTRRFLVHPDAPETAWPQKGQANTEFPNMFVLDVEDSVDESSLILLSVSYRGFRSVGSKPYKVRSDCDTQMLTLPGSGTAGNANFLVPVPQPYTAVERIAGTLPNYQGVGQLAAAGLAFLPSVPDFTITLTSTATPTENYFVGYLLQTRGWEEIIPGKVWVVRERYTYYYRLASA